jgi:hypothetical protein
MRYRTAVVTGQLPVVKIVFFPDRDVVQTIGGIHFKKTVNRVLLKSFNNNNNNLYFLQT